MVPLLEFKNALGVLAQDLSDEEIGVLRDEQDRLADVIFDKWLSEVNASRNVVL